MNLLTTTEIEIRREFNNYYNNLKQNIKIKKIAEQIYLDMKNLSFFKNNKVKIYLAKNHPTTSTIKNVLQDIFNCEFKLIDLNIPNYENYLEKIGMTIDIWLGDIVKDISKINYIDNIYFTNEDFLSTKNILEVLQFNFNIYFNENFIINKNIDINDLEYDSKSKEDTEFYDKLSNLLDPILTKFKTLFEKDITKKDEIIFSLVNNCKCRFIYSLVFNQIYFPGLYENKHSFENKILNIFKK